MPSLEPYNKTLPYSYALGVFGCHHLLDARPNCAKRLLVHPDAAQSEGVQALIRRCAALNVRCEEAGRVLRREAKKDNCFAAIVFDKYEEALAPDTDHVVLVNISDGGNLGTALRACLGFGFRDIAIIRPAVDPFDPHVLRSSMGAFFHMRVRMFDSFDAYRETVPARTLYPFMLDGAIPLGQAAATRDTPCSLVFGNEATGLPKEYQTYGQTVVIPHSDQIDSLNLAVAVAIGAYAFSTT